jgi:DMSO/TMAO reductase YedYZ heme-binding membrane subunit
VPERSRLLTLALATSTALPVLAFLVDGPTEEAVREVVRWSAKLGVVCFCGAFAASSLRTFWRSGLSAWLLRNRRWVGLSFAAFHYLHLAALGVLALAFPSFRESVAPLTLIGGGLAYALLTLQVVTSNDAAVARLGRRRWTRLHTVASYYLWILFFQSYGPRAVQDVAYAPFALLLMAVLGLRIARRLQTHRKAAPPSDPASA